MSNSLAIATVTTALAQLVRSAAQTTVPGAEVLTERPDANATAQPRVRLFLYHATPNAALRNRDLPTRSADGKLVARPTAAMDLQYLLAFYGNESELEPQRMLGAVARDLHAKPVLMKQMITDAVISQGFLNGSNLADAVEQVKFTPLPLTLDELSKIWSVFFQTPYALSLAYQATAVLIESEESAAPALPVLYRGKDDHGVDTVLGPFPVLESLHIGEHSGDLERLRQATYPAARLGAIVTLRGRNLGGDKVTVRFVHPRLSAPKNVQVPPADRTAMQVKITLPADAAAQTNWAAGIYTVTVITEIGDSVRMSSALPLALAPRITNIEPASPIARDPANENQVVLTITSAPQILLTRPTQPGEEAKLLQRVVLLVEDREIPAQLPLLPDPPPPAIDRLNFVMKNAPVVTNSLLRLRVDEIDSLPFKLAGDPPQLAFDEAQRVTIT